MGEFNGHFLGHGLGEVLVTNTQFDKAVHLSPHFLFELLNEFLLSGFYGWREVDHDLSPVDFASPVFRTEKIGVFEVGYILMTARICLTSFGLLVLSSRFVSGLQLPFGKSIVCSRCADNTGAFYL